MESQVKYVSNVSAVDRLGALQAQISELSKEAKKIKLALKARGVGRYSGRLFDALVFERVHERMTVKQLAVKAYKLVVEFFTNRDEKELALTLSARKVDVAAKEKVAA